MSNETELELADTGRYKIGKVNLVSASELGKQQEGFFHLLIKVCSAHAYVYGQERKQDPAFDPQDSINERLNFVEELLSLAEKRLAERLSLGLLYRQQGSARRLLCLQARGGLGLASLQDALAEISLELNQILAVASRMLLFSFALSSCGKTETQEEISQAALEDLLKILAHNEEQQRRAQLDSLFNFQSTEYPIDFDVSNVDQHLAHFKQGRQLEASSFPSPLASSFSSSSSAVLFIAFKGLACLSSHRFAEFILKMQGLYLEEKDASFSLEFNCDQILIVGDSLKLLSFALRLFKELESEFSDLNYAAGIAESAQERVSSKFKNAGSSSLAQAVRQAVSLAAEAVADCPQMSFLPARFKGKHSAFAFESKCWLARIMPLCNEIHELDRAANLGLRFWSFLFEFALSDSKSVYEVMYLLARKEEQNQSLKENQIWLHFKSELLKTLARQGGDRSNAWLDRQVLQASLAVFLVSKLESRKSKSTIEIGA